MYIIQLKTTHIFLFSQSIVYGFGVVVGSLYLDWLNFSTLTIFKKVIATIY